MMEPWRTELPDHHHDNHHIYHTPRSTLNRILPSTEWKKAVSAVIIGFCLLTVLHQSSFLTRDVLTSLREKNLVPTMSSLGSLLQQQQQQRPDPAVTRQTFVVTTTYYPDLSDIRLDIALELCRLARKHEIHLIVVDDSPQHNAIQNKFRHAGTQEFVHVYRQDKDAYAGKGGALRQAIRHATEWIQESYPERGNNGGLNDAVICFIEPEKADMMNHMTQIARPILEGETDVVVPTREDELFKQTYPIEQYHSESFGNLHFDLLAKQFEGFRREGAQKLDWLFGPFAFKASLAGSWLEYQGTSWDAQMIPYVRGVRNDQWRIKSVEVNFRHPREMKEQEEGYPEWTKKRLRQLNLLFDLLGDKELS